MKTKIKNIQIANQIWKEADTLSAEFKYEKAYEMYETILLFYSQSSNLETEYKSKIANLLTIMANIDMQLNKLSQANHSFVRALEIYRNLAQENPRTYLADVAMTLNNLANLHSDKNEFDLALQGYQEALEIYRNLAHKNPRTYLTDVAMTLINLSVFYLQSVPNQEKSIALAGEAVEILVSFHEIPYLANYLKTGIQVLQANEVDVEAFLKDLQGNEE